MSLYSNIYFYGGGAWGQALAISLASIGHGSTLIVSEKSREQEINNHISKRFPEIRLSQLIKASAKNRDGLCQSDLIFITTESKRVIKSIKEIVSFNNKANIISKTFRGNDNICFVINRSKKLFHLITKQILSLPLKVLLIIWVNYLMKL